MRAARGWRAGAPAATPRRRRGRRSQALRDRCVPRERRSIPRLPAATRSRAPPGSPSRGRRSLERAPSLLCLQRVGEAAELAVDDVVEAVLGELDAVVRDAVLGEVVRADLLGALARADLRAALGRQLGLLLLALELVQPRAQHAHRLRLVL